MLCLLYRVRDVDVLGSSDGGCDLKDWVIPILGNRRDYSPPATNPVLVSQHLDTAFTSVLENIKKLA